MKSSVFLDVTPCRLLKVSWCCGGTCYLHLHGKRINQARNQCEAGWLCLLPSSRWFLAWVIFWPWRWRRNVPSKCCFTFSERVKFCKMNICTTGGAMSISHFKFLGKKGEITKCWIYSLLDIFGLCREISHPQQIKWCVSTDWYKTKCLTSECYKWRGLFWTMSVCQIW